MSNEKVCDLSFARPGNLKRHKITHTSEEWVTCFNTYEISSLGNIRRKRDQFEMKKRTHPAGYITCNLFIGRKSKGFLIHRIVAFCFLGSPPDKTYVVNHVNNIRSDNRLVNLRWLNLDEQGKNTSRIKRKRKIELGVRSIINNEIVDYKNIYEAAEYISDLLDLKSKCITIRTCIVKSINGGVPYKGYMWKYISNFPTGMISKIPSIPQYEASSCGMIRQLNGRWTYGRVKNGYCIIGVTDDGIHNERRVHRLIAETFLSDRKPGLNVVNHLNGNKEDNRIVNLEWTDDSGNIKHAYETGLIQITGRPISQIDKITGLVVKKHDSIHDAGISVSGCYQNIIACARGRQKTAYGYRWVY